MKRIDYLVEVLKLSNTFDQAFKELNETLGSLLYDIYEELSLEELHSVYSEDILFGSQLYENLLGFINGEENEDSFRQRCHHTNPEINKEISEEEKQLLLRYIKDKEQAVEKRYDELAEIGILFKMVKENFYLDSLKSVLN
ncbi:hypothetical protein P4679_24000 [Priestia megaterium]|uniref:hypothetical protein n=1 Tax=Priestia megaterium TaxID=1404 RepID=UPI002E229643|nr:hypothetical protein [Priestia megaterium]